jgi:hypothetical protein
MEILLGLVVLIMLIAAVAAIRRAERERPWISKRAMRRFERTLHGPRRLRSGTVGYKKKN